MTREQVVQIALPSLSGPVQSLSLDIDSETAAGLIRQLLGTNAAAIVKAVDCDEPQATDPANWGLQRITLSRPNRVWTDAQLQQLASQQVCLSPDATFAQYLDESHAQSTHDAYADGPDGFVNRDISTQMEIPLLRLVYLPYRLHIHFQGIPDMPEGFTRPLFVTGKMTSADTINSIVEEYGLWTVVTLGSKSARIEYVLNASNQFLHPSSQVMPHLQALSIAGPPYALSMTISTAWIGRIGNLANKLKKATQRPRLPVMNISQRTENTSPSRSAIRPVSLWGSIWYADHGANTSQLEAVPATNKNEEDTTVIADVDRTVKVPQTAGPRKGSTTAASTVNRLSSLFWSSPTAQGDNDTTSRRRMVSAPVPVDDRRVSTMFGGGNVQQSGNDFGDLHAGQTSRHEDHHLRDRFLSVLDELGIKGAQREQMLAFDQEKMQWTIVQHSQRSEARPSTASVWRGGYADTATATLRRASTRSASGSLDGLKRLSLGSIVRTGPSTDAPISDSSRLSLENSERESLDSIPESADNALVPPPPAPLLQSNTGWASWFSAGSPAKPLSTRRHDSPDVTPSAHTAKDTPAFYIQQIQMTKSSQIALVKSLIALRVRLSTSQLSWMSEFLSLSGTKALQTVLDSPGNGNSTLAESRETVQAECVRCLRVILNVEAGFEEIVSNPEVVKAVVACLYAQSLKLRYQAAEVLAPMCVLSPEIGHENVLAAMSASAIRFGEGARFERLVQSLSSVNDHDEHTFNGDVDPDTWEYRRAAIALVNAIVSSPSALETRMKLRSELASRGINEAMTTLGYMDIAEALRTQLRLYADERREDQELAAFRQIKALASEGSADILPNSFDVNPDDTTEIVHMAQKYATVLKHCHTISSEFAASMMATVAAFFSAMGTLNDFEADWQPAMMLFLSASCKYAGEWTISRPKYLADDVMSDLIRIDGSTADASGDLKPHAGLIQSLVSKENDLLDLRNEYDQLVASIGERRQREGGNIALKERDERISSLARDLEIANLATASHVKQLDAHKVELHHVTATLRAAYTELSSSLMNNVPDGSCSTDLLSMSNLATSPSFGDFTLLADRIKIALARSAADIEHSAPAVLNSEHADRTAFTFAGSLIPDSDSRNASPANVAYTAGLGGVVSSVAPNTSPSVAPIVPPPPPPPPPPRTLPPAPRVPVAPPPPSHAQSQANPHVLINSPQVASPVSTAPSPTPPPPPVRNIPAAPTAPPPPPLSVSTSTAKSTAVTRVVQTAASEQFLPSPPTPPIPIVPVRPQPNGALNSSVSVSLAKTSQGTSTGRHQLPSRVKMKPFFWTKLQPPAGQSDSIWNNLKLDNVALNIEELEMDFAAPKLAASKSKMAPQKAEVSSLLAISRAQNIGIMLARMRMSNDDIKAAILKVDDRKLSQDRLKMLISNSPTAEEIQAFTNYTGDLAKLTSSDHYFSIICGIPRLSQRLGCMLTRRKLDLDLEEIRPELAILRNATDEVRQSGNFRRCLEVVLVVGNAMNASTFRGNANGFHLDALQKLRDTRATRASASKKTPTLLHFIAKTLLESYPDAVYFLTECQHIHAAARISLPGLVASVSVLAKAVDDVATEVTVAATSKFEPKDRFRIVMHSFLDEAQPAITTLKQMTAQLEQDVESLLLYFGLDATTTDSEELFRTIASFGDALQAAAEDVHDERQKGATSNATSSQKATQRAIARGDFDEALRDLRSGTGLRRQRREASQARPLSRIFLDGHLR